jgi:hypothetical protein
MMEIDELFIQDLKNQIGYLREDLKKTAEAKELHYGRFLDANKEHSYLQKKIEALIETYEFYGGKDEDTCNS